MDQLRKDGWFINESQTSELFDDGILPKTHQEIQKCILNEDLRHFGEASIINLHKKDESVFDGPCVLQLLRYRNVSVPRIKEELNQADPASSLIRLFFTDGHTSISALVLQTIPGINADTPPGTKIQINGSIPIEAGFLILGKKDVKILGGRVEEMIEKWNVEKSSVRADGFKSKVGKGTGAPKWVSFGKRGQKGGQLEKGFKANSVMPKQLKEGDDTDDFAKNRAEILKELKEDSESTKTFAKPNLAPPPVKAPPPPKERQAPPPKTGKPPPRKGRGRKNSDDGPDIDVGEYANHKPSGPATLFDFIGGGAEKGAELVNVAKLTENTAKMNVSGGGNGGSRNYENRNSQKPVRGNSGNFKKFGNDRPTNSGGGGRSGGPSGQQRYGDRDQRPPRNDTRGPKNPSNFNERNLAGNQSHGPKGPPKSSNFKKPENSGGGRSTTQNQNQNRPNTGPPPASFNSNNRQGSENPRAHQNQQNRPSTGPSAPYNSNNRQGSENPRGQNQQNRQNRPNTGPPSTAGGAHQSNNSRQNYSNYQGNQYGGRQQQNQNVQNFRPNQGQQNFRQHQGPPQNPPRGNFNFQPNQGAPPPPPRGNPRAGQNAGQPAPKGRDTSGHLWHTGDECLVVKPDGFLYPATITGWLPMDMVAVQYCDNQNGVIPFNWMCYDHYN